MFLLTPPVQWAALVNTTLGNLLLADSHEFRADIATSVQLCLVASSSKDSREAPAVPFLPPYAHVNATPYVNMTEVVPLSSLFLEFSVFLSSSGTGFLVFVHFLIIFCPFLEE